MSLGRRMVKKPQEQRENDSCEIVRINPEKVREATKTMPSDAIINALAEVFRSLSDPTRVRIIFALSGREMCVCDLAAILSLTGSAVSHQLRLLRGQRLVRYRKEGKVAYYTLDDEHISSLLAEGVRHINAG